MTIKCKLDVTDQNFILERLIYSQKNKDLADFDEVATQSLQSGLRNTDGLLSSPHFRLKNDIFENV